MAVSSDSGGRQPQAASRSAGGQVSPTLAGLEDSRKGGQEDRRTGRQEDRRTGGQDRGGGQPESPIIGQ